MSVRAVTPILKVSSIAESWAWFEKVGWRPGFCWPEGEEASFGSVSAGKCEH